MTLARPMFACAGTELPPSMEALAAALVGEVPFESRLPVGIAGIDLWCHGVMTWG